MSTSNNNEKGNINSNNKTYRIHNLDDYVIIRFSKFVCKMFIGYQSSSRIYPYSDLYHYKQYYLTQLREDLEYLLNSTSINFNVIAISVTRIIKGKTPINSLNLINYSSHEFSSTESLTGGGILLCICNHLSYI